MSLNKSLSKTKVRFLVSILTGTLLPVALSYGMNEEKSNREHDGKKRKYYFDGDEKEAECAALIKRLCAREEEPLPVDSSPDASRVEDCDAMVENGEQEEEERKEERASLYEIAQQMYHNEIASELATVGEFGKGVVMIDEPDTREGLLHEEWIAQERWRRERALTNNQTGATRCDGYVSDDEDGEDIWRSSGEERENGEIVRIFIPEQGWIIPGQSRFTEESWQTELELLRLKLVSLARPSNNEPRERSSQVSDNGGDLLYNNEDSGDDLEYF